MLLAFYIGGVVATATCAIVMRDEKPYYLSEHVLGSLIWPVLLFAVLVVLPIAIHLDKHHDRRRNR